MTGESVQGKASERKEEAQESKIQYIILYSVIFYFCSMFLFIDWLLWWVPYVLLPFSLYMH